jgi:hypothetical protein
MVHDHAAAQIKSQHSDMPYIMPWRNIEDVKRDANTYTLADLTLNHRLEGASRHVNLKSGGASHEHTSVSAGGG